MASTDSAHKEIGSELIRLRNHRRRADYEDVVTGLDKLVTGDLVLSRKIIEALSTL